MTNWAKLSRDYAVRDGRKFRLRDVDPRDAGGLTSKDKAKEQLQRFVGQLADLQEKLYAQGRWAVLLIVQAMDAAGKDSTIEHVMSGINPQGCDVHSFKQPSTEELNHDFLWRCARHLPERGRIGIFNRSYYEEVLIVRVHPRFLESQNLPPSLVKGDIWRERFEDINAFERHLTRSGTLVLKFFLHVSKQEQKKRFMSRLNEPDKNWKFALGDVREREQWTRYMHAYEDMIRSTATRHAPWYVVPADHKWYTRLVVVSALIQALKALHPKYPEVDQAKRKELAEARRLLA